MAPRDDIKFNWAEKFRSVWKVWSLLLIIVLLLGTIYTGVATPTEASAVSALAVFIIALVRKKLNLDLLRHAVRHTVRTTAMIGWIIIGATSFGYVIIFSGCAAQLSAWIVNLPIPLWSVVLILMLGFLVMGMFLDPAAIVMMTTPLMLPILNALQIDLLWFGVLMTINMCAGNISPPMGLNLYIVKGLKREIDMKKLFYAAIPFIAIDFLTIILCMLFPGIITLLPRAIGY
jgi:tripartite ATP-independent transporter DctM subunit